MRAGRGHQSKRWTSEYARKRSLWCWRKKAFPLWERENEALPIITKRNKVTPAQSRITFVTQLKNALYTFCTIMIDFSFASDRLRKWREFSWPQSEGQAWNSVFIGHTFLYVYASTNLMSQGNEAIDDLCWKPSLSEYKVRIELVVYSRHCNGGLQIFLKPKVVHYRLRKKDKTKLSCLVSILEFMDLMWRWRTEIWYLLRAVFPIL